MSLRVIVLMLIVIVALPAPGQQPAVAQNQAIFESSVDLVLVPVLVRDKRNNHIAAIDKTKFVVLQDGKAVPISIFHEISTPTPAAQAEAYQTGEFGNKYADSTPQQLTVLAIDAINTTMVNQASLQAELLDFLGKAAQRKTPFAVVRLTPKGLRVLVDFTTDYAVIEQAVRRLSPTTSMTNENATSLIDSQRPTDGLLSLADAGTLAEQRFVRMWQVWANFEEMQSQMQKMQDHERRIVTFDQIEQIIRMLAGHKGRKSLIWASASLPFIENMFSVRAETRGFGNVPTIGSSVVDNLNPATPGGNTQQQPPPPGGTKQPQGPVRATPPPRPPPVNDDGIRIKEVYDLSGAGQAISIQEAIWRRLNEADVAVYPVDIRGAVNPAFDEISPETKHPLLAGQVNTKRHGYQDTLATMVNMANHTGGIPCIGHTRVAPCFFDAMADSERYYLLGYYLNRKSTKAGWHELKVKVGVDDARLRSRNGFSVADERATKDVRVSDLQLAVSSPLDFPSLRFRGRWQSAEASGDKRKIPFELSVPSTEFRIDQTNDNAVELEVIAVALDPETKKSVAQTNRTISLRPKGAMLEVIQQRGILYQSALELPAGKYEVKFVIRDSLTGRTGSAHVPLVVN
jgi:VWFA-related protein